MSILDKWQSTVLSQSNKWFEYKWVILIIVLILLLILILQVNDIPIPFLG